MTPRKCCICGIKCENFIEFYDPNQKLGKSLTYSVLDFCDEHRDEFYGLVKGDIFRMRLHLDDDAPKASRQNGSEAAMED